MFRESLLQSSLWEAFQEKNGHTCVAGDFGLAVVETLPIVGKYLYLPRGPVAPISLPTGKAGNFQFPISKLKENLIQVAYENQVGWIRVEPENEVALETLKKEFGDDRIVRAPHDIQPREILVMDITPAEETLLSQMKQKTRYNIRLSEKHGVRVRFSRASEDMETFIELIYTTTSRKAIWPHPKEYYRNFFRVFGENECVLALAEHEGKVLAANLLVFFENTAYYLHGGSSDEGRNLMAPFLLQWESIREAKQRGMVQYNFGGIATNITDSHSTEIKTTQLAVSWAGITRFKQGFAPETTPIGFPGTYDIIFSPWRYQFYRIIRGAQKIKNLFRS